MPYTKFFSALSALPSRLKMPDLSEYMTVKEAAEKLGFTVPGVHKLIKKNRLESLSVGRFYLVSKASVQAYLEITRGLSKNDPTRGKTPEI